MAISSGVRMRSVRRAIRSALVGPQLAAFLPAIMLGAYWFGGEGVMLVTAVLFPTLLAFLGLITREEAKMAGRNLVTGLPGRAATIQHINARLETSGTDGPVCIVLEIDNFGSSVGQFGESGSETVEKAAAERLLAVVRETDYVSQLGRGVFSIVLGKTPRTDLEAMLQLSARLQDAMSAPFAIDNARILITASVGFALPNRVPELTAESILACAEGALEEALLSGPGSVRAFSRGMKPRPSLPDNVTKEVIKALEDGQIRPWFQPQVSTETGEITGFEALARWHHPEKGMISPGAFLPAIARAGLFERLGEVILFHSLSAIREWDKAGLPVPTVAVNCSPEELRNPKLHERIKWELDRFDLSPDRLTIEILEDVVAQSDDDTTVRNVAALANLGCSIDLDDFGTGHASIANIRRFDVNRIKIDRSFVTHVDTDREQQNMVAAILTMAERLGLETLGEGVESHGEHNMLAQLGCNHVQGYSIAKPMPFQDTIAWIKDHERRKPEVPRIPRKAG